MIISIASGKGGTGKTTVAANLALVLARDFEVQVIDADVEAPNAHILLKPVLNEVEEVFLEVPHIDAERCSGCGICQKVCAFNALALVKNDVLFFEELCHGCGACMVLCPEKAITESSRQIGLVETGMAGDVLFARGRINPGEVLAPFVIRAVKRKQSADALVLVDSPPGTSCAAVSAVSGSDFCLLVTESTPFGLHDLQLAVSLLQKLKIPTAVVINKAGHGDERVDKYCEQQCIPVLARIPYDRQVAEVYASGRPAVTNIEGWDVVYESLGALLLQQASDAAHTGGDQL